MTDRPTPKIIRVQEFGVFLTVVQNPDYDEEKNTDPIFYDNDSNIDNEPDVGDTVIDDDNKFGVICDRSDAYSQFITFPVMTKYIAVRASYMMIYSSICSIRRQGFSRSIRLGSVAIRSGKKANDINTSIDNSNFGCKLNIEIDMFDVIRSQVS